MIFNSLVLPFIACLFIYNSLLFTDSFFFGLRNYRKRESKKGKRKKGINFLIDVNFGMFYFGALMLELIFN